MTPDGMDAILRLSGGDMRRVLNLLQATTMSSTTVDETAVYLTSGAPLPVDIDRILFCLLNETFGAAVREIMELCTTKGYALADVLQEITSLLTRMDMESVPLAMILDGMSNIEHRLAFGTDEKIQIASLVGVFVKTRQLITVVG